MAKKHKSKKEKKQDIPVKKQSSSFISFLRSHFSFLMPVFSALGFIRSKLKYLDPFYYAESLIARLLGEKMGSSKFFVAVEWIAYGITGIVSAYLLLFSAGVLLGTDLPGVIILSGSMEPVMYRGDVIILQGTDFNSLSAPLVELDSEKMFFSVMRDCSVKDVFGGYAFSCIPTDVVFFETEKHEKEIKSVPITIDGDIVVYDAQLHSSIPIIHRAVVKVRAGEKELVITKGDNNPYLDLFPIFQKPICANRVDVTFDSFLGWFSAKANDLCVTGGEGPISQRPGISYPVEFSAVHGKAIMHIPYVGWFKLLVFGN
ncbi:MAG: hypothetical protein KAS30_04230 [Candidatus Diapherotrites archaeon]|nr:hypothetical protein [Candidatus Diapherotrites archaeon]